MPEIKVQSFHPVHCSFLRLGGLVRCALKNEGKMTLDNPGVWEREVEGLYVFDPAA